MGSPPARTQAATPLRAEELATALTDIVATTPHRLVLAVSGGPDSICLMHLMAALDLPVAVATVDHGLRDGSDRDADFVLAEAAALGLPAHRLVWEGPKPSRAVQERAREARYGLLAALCGQLGAQHLVTAHTLDDQAETILFRLARGSGPAGLSGMGTSTPHDGIVHVRPLLGVPKARLVAACEAAGWRFVHDPSNHDPRFARTRLRGLLPLLAAEGLDAARLARLAERARRSDAALRRAAERLRAEAMLEAAPGTRRLDAALLSGEPAELVIRVLATVIGDIGPQRFPRLERLERLAATLQAALAARVRFKSTLGGTVLALAPSGILTIVREAPRGRGTGDRSPPD